MRPPAPLVDGRLSWVGAYRPPASPPLVPSVRRLLRWSLLLRALGEGSRGAAGLVGCSANRRATCDLYTKKYMSLHVFAEIRGKNIWFSFFFSTRITCKFYTGIPNEKKFQKILFGCWMTSRFHVFDTRSLPPAVSLDFCRQSCVVVFLVDGGPLIWKFREEKAGEIFVAGKLAKTCRKTSSSSATRKKKSEKGGRSQENAAQGAAAGKVQTMAPSRPALALPHPLSGQPIHSCFFGSLALSPGPSSLAATPRATRRRDLATAAPRASCLSETTARITQSGKANRNSRCCCCCVVVVVVFRKMTSPMPSWFSNFSCPQ